MRDQVEVKLSIYDIIRFDEARVNEGALRWVQNLSISFFKEPLSDSLIDHNQSDFRELDLSIRACAQTVLLHADVFQLLQLCVYHLLSHRVTHSVTIDENVVWELTLVVVAIGLECTRVVLLKD